MDRLVKGNGSIAIGVDAGFAVGRVGMYANHSLSSLLLLPSGFIYSSNIPQS
jgi:hypothetical protein